MLTEGALATPENHETTFALDQKRQGFLDQFEEYDRPNGLYSIVHDVNNKLGVFFGYRDLILSDLACPEGLIDRVGQIKDISESIAADNRQILLTLHSARELATKLEAGLTDNDQAKKALQTIFEVEQLPTLTQSLITKADELEKVCSVSKNEAAEAKNPRVAKGFEEIFKASNEMTRLTQRLNPENRGVYENQEMDLNNLLQTQVRKFNRSYAKGLSLSFHGKDAVKVLADPWELIRSLENAVLNCRQSIQTRMEHGGQDLKGEISISLGEQNRDNQPYGTITIKDNGTGMGEDQIASFNAHRGLVTTKPTGNGKGLREAQYYIIQQLGGDIQATNVPGGGLEITISIPKIQPTVY